MHLFLKKEIKVNTAQLIADNYVLDCLERISSWHRRVLCTVIKFIRRCQKKEISGNISMADMSFAECTLLTFIQNKYLSSEIERVRSNKVLKSTAIAQLNSFVGDMGLLRVGGRLSNAHVIDEKSKHPIILPKVGCIQIIEWYHMDTKHSGRSSTVNSLRQNGY